MIFVVFMWLVSGMLFAEQKKILEETKDVTGDGIPEKIYTILHLPAGNSVYKTICVEQKTTNGWINIFPEKFPFQKVDQNGNYYYPNIGEIGKLEFGYIADKFDASCLGLQIVVYWFYSFDQEQYLTGYFFKKDKNDRKFKFYKIDITDKKYPRLYSKGSRPDYESIIKKEFKHRETRFAKSFKISCKLLEFCKNNDWDNAKKLCSNQSCIRKIDGLKNGEWCRHTKIHTVYLHPWDVEMDSGYFIGDEIKRSICFYSGAYGGMFSVTVNRYLKIEGISFPL